MIRFISMFVVLVVALAPYPATAEWSITENFTTTDHRDDFNTTADWNTVDAEVRMFPFVPTLLDSYVSGDNAFDVTIQGSVAYLVDNPNVRIFDISDPTTIILRSTTARVNPQAVFIDGDLLYIADGEAGLVILDVRLPEAPSQLGILNTPGFAFDVVVEGNLAYVADGGSGVRIIDVSDPTVPVLLGVYDTPNQAHGIDVEGDLCYVADRGNSGIIVLDVTDPTAPFLVGGLVMSADTWNIQVQGDVAYVADTSAGLGVLDVSEPSSPVLIGSLDPGTVRQLVVSGDRVYVAGYSEFHIIDITNPAAPGLVESWTTPGICSGVALAGEFVVLADGTAGGMSVLEVRDVIPQPIELNSQFSTSGNILDLRVAGDLAYLVEAGGTFKVVDISGLAPIAVSSTYIGSVGALELAGNIAYLSSYPYLRIFDISDPSAPLEVGTPLIVGGFASKILIRGDILFAALGIFGVDVIDISDPLAPSLITQVNAGAQICSTCDVQGNYLYVAPWGTGLTVYNISTPTLPVLTGTWLTSAYLRDVEVAGDFALVIDDQGLFRTIDVSNPSSIVLSGIKGLGGSGGEIAHSGNRAFVTGNSIGMAVLDISDPAFPRKLGSALPDHVGSKHIALAGDRLWMGASSSLVVYQVFQSEFDGYANVARSEFLPIPTGSEDALRVRLHTAQTAGVEFGIRTDEAYSYQPILPDGQWNEIEDPGAKFNWESTHHWFQTGVNPSVQSLTIDWLVAPPKVEAVADIPNDQGRQVRIEWSRSGHDFVGDPNQIVEYAVYRQIEPGLGAELARTTERPELSGVARDHAARKAAASWDFLTTVPVRTEDLYAVVVSTLADSTVTEGIHLTTFMVSALTGTPGVYYDSDPIAGYSRDNLAPGSPQNLAAGYHTGSGNTLLWDESGETDFAHFRVYRSWDPGFEPTPQDLVAEPSGPGWVDPDFDGGAVYYRVSTVDFSGNESEFTAPETVTATEPVVAPRRFALHANVPNPFNPSTEIRYEVPADAGHISLRIYDTAGRLVRTLIDGTVDAGRRTVDWEGRTNEGEAVASGVYFYRLEGSGFAQTRKMTLVK